MSGGAPPQSDDRDDARRLRARADTHPLLWDALTGAKHHWFHCWDGNGYEGARWDEVVNDAAHMTAGLRRAGVRPGVRVAAILTNGGDVVRGLLGAWLAGGTIASLPIPARGMGVEEYGQQLRSICNQLEPAFVLIEERMAGLLKQAVGESLDVRTWESFRASGKVEPSPPDQDDVAFIQYSSGSTSAPKGCLLSPRAIRAQLGIIYDLLDGDRDLDLGVSWLPLSHDLGLFGMLLFPWAYDADLYLSTPERFIKAPRTWFGDVSEVGATITAGTNTGLNVAARAYSSARLPQQLRLRTCLLGGERIEWDTLRYASETLRPYGLEKTALRPAYGLAEAALAVTATPLSEDPRSITLDAIALADGQLREVEPDSPHCTRMVSAGVPCTGVELPGLSGDALEEIRVRSRSLASGYLGDEVRTRERFRDGVFQTGDLGFMRDGYLYPVGRLDDLISIGGRKVYAREIEAAVDALDGARRGCATLVERGTGGVAQLTLLVELKAPRDDYRSLASQAATLAMTKAGVGLHDCMFLEPGSLPKTPSGKIQRHRCRQLLDTEQLEALATVTLG